MPIMDKAFISHFAKFNANAVTIRNENWRNERHIFHCNSG